METNESPTPEQEINIPLEPFAYHKRLRDHFKSRQNTWNWFAKEQVRKQQVSEFKSALLKNTYRLDRDTHNNLYTICTDVCQQLAIDAEVTLYQENNSVQLNAGISIIDREAHIVLSGNLLNLLSEVEIKALLGHELSHYLFYKTDNEEFEITQRIVLALANDQRSDDAIIETARVFQLYMELFCDLGALKVCGDHKIAIQTLVKINTGLSDVNAQSYLEQAQEILKSDSESTQQSSHPESYIRSLALQLSAELSPDYLQRLAQMIEGPLDINYLDIFEQTALQSLTREFIQCLVKPAWINSALVVNLCKEYFDDFYRNDNHRTAAQLAEAISPTNDSVKNYLCYVLLDFARVDADMEAAPLGFTLELAELLDVIDLYEKLLRSELKLSVRDFKQLKESAMRDLQSVGEDKNESLYSE